MTTACLACLNDVRAPNQYHRRCLEKLFGTSRLPEIEVEQAKLHTLAGAMVEHTSISGTQRKISLGFTQDRARLRVPDLGGEYILKPQTGTYPALPENEHATMRLAELFGLQIPPCGLVHLRDGSYAYIVARFDRPRGGGKLRQEDFCQLSLKSPKEKYTGSAEQCVRVIRRYSDQPGVDLLKLYRQWVFAWWVGNGDMHLKNFSLMAAPDRLHRLSPAYDLVSTRLVIEDDRLALQLGGRDKAFTRRSWLDFADYSGIPARAADRVLAQPAKLAAKATALIGRSYLPTEFQEAYASLIEARLESFEV